VSQFEVTLEYKMQRLAQLPMNVDW